MPDSCGVKMRPWPDSEIEVACYLELGHTRAVHEGEALHPRLSRQFMSWLRTDPRNFVSDFRPCPKQPCFLPAFHVGEHQEL